MLRDADIPASEVLTAPAMFGEPQLEAQDYYQAIDHPVTGTRRHPKWPMRFSFLGSAAHPRPAPLLGQHNDEILVGELGLRADEMAELRADGIIGQSWPALQASLRPTR